VFTAVATTEVDMAKIDRTPARIIVNDLCAYRVADVLWDGTRADVLAGAHALAKRVRGGVRIVTVSGLTYYPEELGY